MPLRFLGLLTVTEDEQEVGLDEATHFPLKLSQRLTALTGDCELDMSCDIIIAAETVKFGFRFSPASPVVLLSRHQMCWRNYGVCGKPVAMP